MLAAEMLLAMRHSMLDKAVAPAIAAASAIGSTGKRNRVIPELAPMAMLLASQTMIAVRQVAYCGSPERSKARRSSTMDRRIARIPGGQDRWRQEKETWRAARKLRGRSFRCPQVKM